MFTLSVCHIILIVCCFCSTLNIKKSLLNILYAGVATYSLRVNVSGASCSVTSEKTGILMNESANSLIISLLDPYCCHVSVRSCFDSGLIKTLLCYLERVVHAFFTHPNAMFSKLELEKSPWKASSSFREQQLEKQELISSLLAPLPSFLGHFEIDKNIF